LLRLNSKRADCGDYIPFLQVTDSFFGKLHRSILARQPHAVRAVVFGSCRMRDLGCALLAQRIFLLRFRIASPIWPARSSLRSAQSPHESMACLMSAVSITERQSSSHTSATSGHNSAGRGTKITATTIAVMEVVRKLWPAKPDFALMDKAGAAERTCRYWLELKYNIKGEALANLLRSDEGFLILEAVMGNAKPRWWIDFKRSVKLADLKRELDSIAAAIAETG
jgi:hypothetical protein